MSEIVTFAVRLVVYSGLTWAGGLVIPTENALPFTRSMRLSVAALQVAVLCASVLVVLGVQALVTVVLRLEQRSARKRDLASELDLELQSADTADGADVGNMADLTDLTDLADLADLAGNSADLPDAGELTVGTSADDAASSASTGQTQRALRRGTARDAERAGSASEAYEYEEPELQSKALSGLSREGLARAVRDTQSAVQDAEAAGMRRAVHLVTPVRCAREDEALLGRATGKTERCQLFARVRTREAAERDGLLRGNWPCTFVSERDLTYYIFKVQLVGLALWQTFLCFDCTARDIDINFIIGLVTGWLCAAVGGDWNAQLLYVAVTASACLTVLFTERHMLFTAVIRVETLGVWQSMRDIFNMVVLPFVTGVFWTYVVSSSSLVRDVQRSLVTFILISLSLPLYWTVIDQAVLQSLLVDLPHLSMILLLVVEPMLKCLGIFVLLVSVQNGKVQSLVVALVTVVAVGNIAQDDFKERVQHPGVHVASAVLLLALHAVHMCCWGRCAA